MILLYIKCTKNNTIVSIVQNKKTLTTITCGLIGIKGAKKSTRHATQEVIKFTKDYLIEKKLTQNIIIIISGFNRGRTSILRALNTPNLHFIKIIDNTKIQHNGCRLKKKRRI